VLLEARYVRDKGPTDPRAGPPNLTQNLEGNRLRFIGAGEAPLDVLAVSLKQQPSINFADASRTRELVPGATRDYWITKEQDGSLSVATVDNDSLYRSARDVILNDGLFVQMKASLYRYALTNMIAAGERNATSKESKQAAAKLLSERKEALEALNAIDGRLNEALELAKKANRDADIFAITATLAGAGASILQATTSNPGNQKPADSSVTTTTERKSTASGAIIELVRQRVEVGGKVLKSDEEVGAYLQENGKTVYVPLR
jgi:hypothetical protein